MSIERDKFDQLATPWTDEDYELLAILEEISTDPEYTDNPNRPLAAYMADIKELLE